MSKHIRNKRESSTPKKLEREEAAVPGPCIKSKVGMIEELSMVIPVVDPCKTHHPEPQTFISVSF